MKKVSLLLLMICLMAFGALQAKPTDPLKTFDKFWNIMDRHYAFFELKNVDWNAVKAKYRPQITENTSDDELFAILSEILDRFDDAHITLKSDKPEKRQFKDSRASIFDTEFPTDSLKRLYFAMVENSLSRAGFAPLKRLGPVLSDQKAVYDHTPFEYSSSADFGYIKISWIFYNFLKLNTFTIPRDRTLFLQCFDTSMASMPHSKGLILDLRNNIGGMTGHSEKLVSRLSTRDFIGEYHQRRNGPDHESFSKNKAVKVKAAKGSAYTHPIVVLVNDKTVSAAEELLIMLKELPQVTVVGTHSQGALSDIYDRKLPNGWTLTLSNMRFYDPDMVCHEGKGIAPDVEVTNSQNDLETQADPVLAKAFEILKEKTKTAAQ